MYVQGYEFLWWVLPSNWRSLLYQVWFKTRKSSLYSHKILPLSNYWRKGSTSHLNIFLTVCPSVLWQFGQIFEFYCCCWQSMVLLVPGTTNKYWKLGLKQHICLTGINKQLLRLELFILSNKLGLGVEYKNDQCIAVSLWHHCPNNSKLLKHCKIYGEMQKGKDKKKSLFSVKK